MILVFPTFRGTFSRSTNSTTNSLVLTLANHAPEFGPKLSILLVISARIFSDLLQFGPLGHEGLALLLGNTFYQRFLVLVISFEHHRIGLIGLVHNCSERHELSFMK